MFSLTQFSESDLNNAIAEFGPAETVVSGKTTTEKRLSVINNATNATRLFAAQQKGKVGIAARDGLQREGMAMITRAACHSNYKPLSEALSLIMADSVFISNRASFESLKDRYVPMARQLESAGKAWKNDKMTAKFAGITQALILIDAVYEGVAAAYAQTHAE